MIRVLVFLAVLLALAFGFSWLADHPGELTLVWQGAEVKTSTMVVAIAIVAFAVIVLFLAALFRSVARTPGAVGSFFQRRKRERGWRALSQGMIAVGAGDPSTAGRLATEARKALGGEPLALLLEAQAAQLSGDRAGAHDAFERMLEDPETRLLGLRGLYVEAGRYNDASAARHFAQEANTLAPRVGWAGQALLEFQSQDRDWDGALATLERNGRNRIVDKARAKRLRAVLLTARATEIELGEPEIARNLAMEAHGLAPDLVPASVLASRLLARGGDIKRAARVIETTWRQEPHPELADAYAHIRPGDSAQDRLARIKDLIRVRAHHPECALALAKAELDAKNFGAARTALKPVMQPVPTRRACLIMAEIEEAKHGASGSVRGWLARAVRAPRDPAWVADGFVAERWSPVSPVSGRLDAFEWKVPADLLAGPMTDPIDDAEEAWAESGGLVPLETVRPEPVSAAKSETAAKPEEARPAPVLIEAAPEPAKPATPAAPAPVKVEAAAPAPAPVVAAAEPAATAAATPTVAPAPPAPVATPAATPLAPAATDKVVVLPKPAAESIRTVSPYPIGRAPDDPGPGDGTEQPDSDEPSKRFRLFS